MKKITYSSVQNYQTLLNLRLVKFLSISVFFVLFFSVGVYSQQVIGTFSYMDGGFEGQVAGNLTNATSTSAWSVSSTSTAPGTRLITNSSSSARTGSKYCTFSNTSSPTNSRRLQSPTTSTSNWIQVSTAYTVQYYYRYAGATAPSTYQGAIYNTSSNSKAVAVTTNGANNSWNKVTASVTSVSNTPDATGFGCVRSTATDAVDVDIDDFVIYLGAVDNTAANPPTSPVQSAVAALQQTISWTAASGGVDGGGYMVVRSTVDPTAVPNTNGIYAVGNTVSDNIGGVIGTIVYIGTNTSFTDLNLTASTPYYYRIYTVDKAFNYSSAATFTASTSAPSYATTPTAQITGINFSSPVSIASTSTGLTINWTAAGSGGGTNHLVVVNASSSFSADPINGTSYSPNTVFGSGTALGGGYVVYNGTGTSVAVTGLTKLTTYYIRVYDFNGSGGTESYLITSPASANQLSPRLEIYSKGTSGAGVSWAQTGSSCPWVGGVAPGATDNAHIVSPDIITISSSEKSCYNLTIDTGAKLYTPNSSSQTFQIFGTDLICNGTLGDNTWNTATPSVCNSLLTLEFGGNLTISGAKSGTNAWGIYPYRLRPITGYSNIGVTFNASTEIVYTATAIMSDNGSNDNIFYTVNSPATLTVDGNWNMASSTGTNGTASTTITINLGATATLLKAFATPIANSKTCTVNVNGTLNGGTSCTPYSYSGGTTPNDNGGTVIFNVNGTLTTQNLNVSPAVTAGTSGIGGTISAPATINVGIGGTLTVTGTADFSNTSLLGFIGGSGTFNLSSGGTISLAHTSGLEPVAGPIRTTNRNFNTGANYSFVGSVAQVTGSNYPSTVNNLTINNAAGVTLSGSATVNGNIVLTSGLLNPSTYTLTSVGSVNGASATSYVNGALTIVFAAIGSKTFAVGKGGNYRPVTINATFLDVTPSTFTVDQTESAFSGTLPAHTISMLARNWSVAQSGSTAYIFDLTLADAGFTPTGTPKILQNNAGTIISYSTTYTYTASGISSAGSFGLGDFVALTPQAPTIGTATAGNAQASVTFTAPLNDGGSSIIDYTVIPYIGAVAGTSVTGTSSPLTVTGLTNGTSYTFTVTARNSVGSSSASSASNSTTPLAPQTTITDTQSATGLSLNSSSVVTIASGGLLNIDQNTSTSSITVQPGGKLTLSDGKTLTSTVTLQNSTSASASFVDSNVSDTPPVVAATVNQDIAATDRNWYVSVPVSGKTTTALTFGASIVQRDEPNAGWLTLNSGDNLVPGVGYISLASTAGTTTWNISGNLNSGLVTVPVTCSGATYTGFNLLGNPYPSYLNWSALLNLNSTNAAILQPTIWYRTKNGGTYSFQTYNATGDLGTPLSASGYIPPMQAFWVRANAGGGTVTLNNAMRSHGDGSANMLKARAVNNAVQPVLRLEVQNQTTNNTDEAVVYFNSNASNGYDAYDSQKLSNNSASMPEIFTVAGSEQLVINGMNSVTLNQEIPLGFTTGQSNAFSIKATQISNFDAGTQVILIDNQTNTQWNLSDGSAYNFSSDITTSNTSRFSVVFKAASITTGNINSNGNSNSILIYRNANNLITVNCINSIVGQATMNVYNAIGQKLEEKTLTSSITVLDKSFTAGVYMVSVVANGKTSTQKVVIN